MPLHDRGLVGSTRRQIAKTTERDAASIVFLDGRTTTGARWTAPDWVKRQLKRRGLPTTLSAIGEVMRDAGYTVEKRTVPHGRGKALALIGFQIKETSGGEP